ncbi:MAG: hypothetical protein R3C49_14715 [Planctomycetaceae bacterium]
MKTARFAFPVLLLASVIWGIQFHSTETVQATPSVPTDDQAQVVEDSMHEFMEYVFQPTYRRLKASMAAAPADNAGWKAIKSDSLILAESCNLLFARLPETDSKDWAHHSATSRTAAADVYQAARAKDFDRASASWKAMLENCNACHRQFENGKHILTP